MTNKFRSPMWSASLVASALMLASVTAAAQAPPPPPPEQPPPEAPPPPPPPPPAPPAAEGAPITMGKTHEIMVGPETWFRFGIQMQAWANYQQSPTRVAGSDGGYSFDLYLRRARFFMGAQIMKNFGAF